MYLYCCIIVSEFFAIQTYQIQLTFIPEDLDADPDKQPDHINDMLAYNSTRIRLVLSN